LDQVFSVCSAEPRSSAGLFFGNGLYGLRRKEVRNLATVTLRPNESQEQLLKRFRKKVAKSGILSTVRRKRWFVSKSELRRIDKKKAIRRHKRRQITDAE
jgi:small subunit ribosomal protein S21